MVGDEQEPVWMEWDVSSLSDADEIDHINVTDDNSDDLNGTPVEDKIDKVINCLPFCFYSTKLNKIFDLLK